MKKQIEQLENDLLELKKSYEIKEKMEYENSVHKTFKEGDIVSRGNEVGIVGWTENKAINCPESAGYMGISLITGTRGFLALTKRDEWELVNDPYYTNVYEIKLELTGLEIEDLLYYIGPPNFNPNSAKSKLINRLRTLK